MAATGCQAKTTVDIEAKSNASGKVSVTSQLDKEATAATPNLAKQLQTSDLAAAGWTVDGPTKKSDGTSTVAVSHTFGSLDEANALLGQLSGPNGAFSNFRLTQDRNAMHVTSGFAGTVDLTKGINSFGSSMLQARTGQALGFDPAEVQQALGVNLAQSFPVDLKVDLPGSAGKVTPLADGNTWHLTYGTTAHFSTTSRGLNAEPLTFMTLAVVFLGGFAVLAWKWRPSTPRHRPQHSARRGNGVRARDLLMQGFGGQAPQT